MDDARTRDEDLVARLLAGDDLALERLYDRYGRAIYSLILRMLRDPTRAEDLTQEVFLKLWRSPRSYQPERGPFATWLLSVAHHRGVDDLRSRRHLTVPLEASDGSPVHAVDDGADLADLAWLRERRLAVRAALASLPAAQRQAIELAYFGGLTQREIAERLREPLGTVKTRIRLAMLKLKTGLANIDSLEPEITANGPITTPGHVARSAEARRADV